jgi:8-oxo-dGTP diphosphatase
MTDRRGDAAGRAKIQLTVDVVIFVLRDALLRVLLVRRGIAPYRGRWAIPGGFVLERESLEAAARRELREETGLTDVYLEQLYTFGDVGRDPRGRVVTVAYMALLSGDAAPVVAGSDATEVRWHRVDQLPTLAFDHREILDYAVVRLRNKLEYTTVGFELLPEKFTLSDLQRVYEAILGKALDKRNFRKKIEALDVLTPLDEWRSGPRRPARLYMFSAERFELLKDKGVLFPFRDVGPGE